MFLRYSLSPARAPGVGSAYGIKFSMRSMQSRSCSCLVQNGSTQTLAWHVVFQQRPRTLRPSSRGARAKPNNRNARGFSCWGGSSRSPNLGTVPRASCKAAWRGSVLVLHGCKEVSGGEILARVDVVASRLTQAHARVCEQDGCNPIGRSAMCRCGDNPLACVGTWRRIGGVSRMRVPPRARRASSLGLLSR